MDLAEDISRLLKEEEQIRRIRQAKEQELRKLFFRFNSKKLKPLEL